MVNQVLRQRLVFCQTSKCRGIHSQYNMRLEPPTTDPSTSGKLLGIPQVKTRPRKQETTSKTRYTWRHGAQNHIVILDFSHTEHWTIKPRRKPITNPHTSQRRNRQGSQVEATAMRLPSDKTAFGSCTPRGGASASS